MCFYLCVERSLGTVFDLTLDLLGLVLLKAKNQPLRALDLECVSVEMEPRGRGRRNRPQTTKKFRIQMSHFQTVYQKCLRTLRIQFK